MSLKLRSKIMSNMDKIRKQIAEAWGVEANNGPSEDQLQNELILIKHHVQDALQYLEEGEKASVIGSLKDIGESVDRLAEFLRPKNKNELFRTSEGD